MDQLRLFGRRLRSIRKAARITQEHAAEKAHLNAKYLGEIERGEKRPSFEAIVALSKAMDVSPAAFFQFDKEEMSDKVLRKRIDALLQSLDIESLRKVYQLVRAFVEP